MADAKHTPGPWVSRDGLITPARNDQLEIAEVFCELEGDYDEDGIAGTARADGLLIAAAPELPEALEAEEEWRGREAVGELDPEWDYEVMVGAKRRAAIAKATGSAS